MKYGWPRTAEEYTVWTLTVQGRYREHLQELCQVADTQKQHYLLRKRFVDFIKLSINHYPELVVLVPIDRNSGMVQVHIAGVDIGFFPQGRFELIVKRKRNAHRFVVF
jgi:hypothetical protein